MRLTSLLRKPEIVGVAHAPGFCCVSDVLPLPQNVTSELVLQPEIEVSSGLNAAFNKRAHCVAAEPQHTFLRFDVIDCGREVAFETAVLGRLQRGYRVFQMRGAHGTRIELCFVFVHISFGQEPHLWASPRQVRLQAKQRASQMNAHLDEMAKLTSEMAKTKRRESDAAAELAMLRAHLAGLGDSAPSTFAGERDAYPRREQRVTDAGEEEEES